jgi:Fe-S-cluster-containing dehydrogenase component
MDGASTDKIIAIVNDCPTDALTFSWNKDLKKDEIPKKEEPIENNISEPPTRIQIMQNGPAIISGDFIIKDINGNKLAKANTIAICRCGHSNNMPFCDGSHNKSGFTEKR